RAQHPRSTRSKFPVRALQSAEVGAFSESPERPHENSGRRLHRSRLAKSSHDRGVFGLGAPPVLSLPVRERPSVDYLPHANRTLRIPYLSFGCMRHWKSAPARTPWRKYDSFENPQLNRRAIHAPRRSRIMCDSSTQRPCTLKARGSRPHSRKPILSYNLFASAATSLTASCTCST